MPDTAFGAVKFLKAVSKEYGAVSFSYHAALAYRSLSKGYGVLSGTNEPAFSINSFSEQEMEIVGRVHDYVLSKGTSVTLAEIIRKFTKTAEPPNNSLLDRIASTSIVDELIIPAFGPFKVDAVVGFGFPFPFPNFPWINGNISNNRLFWRIIELLFIIEKNRRLLALSKRERDIILDWLAKSRSDIATITGLTEATIDTYTRRIFKKLEVNDRLSAVLAGVAGGHIRL